MEVEEKEEVEVEVQGEPASSWGVLNQIGVEVSARIRLLLSLSCCRFEMGGWIEVKMFCVLNILLLKQEETSSLFIKRLDS